MIRDITKGRSAKVCEGISLKNGKAFAVKLQLTEESDSVLREATILKNIQEEYTLMVDYGLPLCHCAGREGKYNFALIDLYSDTLLNLLKKCKGIFKIKTFIMLAEQMLKRLEFLHRQGYLHRSISLKKFMIGLENNSKKLYMVGLGKGKIYIKDGVHIPFKDKLKAKGDKRYMSINQHLGL